MTENALEEINSNVPATIEDLELALNGLLDPAPDDSILAKLGVERTYLPYIQLVQKGGQLTEEPFNVPVGSFALKRNKTTAEDLGASLDVYVCHWRAKAMHSDDVAKRTISLYNIDDPRFNEWRSLAEAKVDGYWWGYEFLLFLGDTGEFCTLFCNNPTLRRAAREVMFPFTRKFATIASGVVKDDKHTWKGITCTKCSTPLTILPDIENVRSEVDRFKALVNAPIAAVAEDAAETEDEDR